MATVTVETTSQYGELIRGVGVKFMDVYNQSLSSYSSAVDEALAVPGNDRTRLFKRKQTQDKVIHFLQKTGVGYLTLFGEGEGIPEDSRILGYKTSVTPQTVGSSITVTMQAIKTRDYQRQLGEFGDLTVASKETVDKTAFDMFNYAFTAQSSLPTNIYGYGDGKPLCSTLHPRKDGGSAQSNASAAGDTLSDTSLETGRIALMRQLDDRGKPNDGGGGKLILLVPPELEKTAVVLAKSEKKIDTFNNNINIYDGLLTVISSKWVAYAGNGGSLPSTAWFLIDPSIANFCVIEHELARTHTFTDPVTLNQKFFIYSWFAIAWLDWRGVYGSKGDVAVYSS